MRVGEIEGLRKSRQSAGAQVIIIDDLLQNKKNKAGERETRCESIGEIVAQNSTIFTRVKRHSGI